MRDGAKLCCLEREYVLFEAIELYPEFNEETREIYRFVGNQLYKLYRDLLDYGFEVSDLFLEKVKVHHPLTDTRLFDLYDFYQNMLNGLENSLSCEEDEKEVEIKYCHEKNSEKYVKIVYELAKRSSFDIFLLKELVFAKEGSADKVDYLEAWLSETDNIEEWIVILSDLLAVWTDVYSDNLLVYHPLRGIDDSEIKEYIDIIRCASKDIQRVKSAKGGIKEHLEAVKSLGLSDEFIDAVSSLENFDYVFNDISFEYMASNIESILKRLYEPCFDNERDDVFPFTDDIRLIMSEIGITYRFKEYDEYEEYCVKKPCKIKKLNDGQKNEYTLTELSLFRLCPKLFFLRGRSECSFYVSEKALAMYYIAVVRIASLSEFASDNYNKKIVYKVEKSDYIDSIKEIVEKNVKKYAPFFSFMDEKEREIVEDAVLKKVVNYVDDAKNFAKSNRFTVIPYGDTEYDCEGYRLIIHHICRVVDYDKKVWRARENEIDLDIVTANSVEKSFRNAHYWQITEELHENKPTINRVKLVSQIVTKIGVQYENKRYFVDGVERTNELVELVRNCDFSTERQMKSDFCPYCMMKDIC